LTGLSLGVPGRALRLLESPRPAPPSLNRGVDSERALSTALYGLLPSVLATLMALPVALLAGPPSRPCPPSGTHTYLVLALPAWSSRWPCPYFTERYRSLRLPDRADCWILATHHVPPERPVRGQGFAGRGPVTWIRWPGPLASPGSRCCFGSRASDRSGLVRRLSAWCSCRFITDLTATLILIPTGVPTLASQFWGVRDDPVVRAGRPVRPW